MCYTSWSVSGDFAGNCCISFVNRLENSYTSRIRNELKVCAFNLMVSTEASWWNILNLKIRTTLGYIVSLTLLNLDRLILLGHVSQVQEDYWNSITKSCVHFQKKFVLLCIFHVLVHNGRNCNFEMELPF